MIKHEDTLVNRTFVDKWMFNTCQFKLYSTGSKNILFRYVEWEEISITCEDRDYKTAFFKEMNKNLHKKEFRDIDYYVVNKNLDIAYTMKKDNKIMRCYHGNMKTSENASLKYFLTISVPNNDLNSPRVEKSTFTFSDKRKVAISIEVNQGNHYCNAVVKDTKTAKLIKNLNIVLTHKSRVKSRLLCIIYIRAKGDYNE